MLNNPFVNARRSTYDGYEFQEYVQGCGWEYSHTDVGYYTMLVNKAAYADNQALGGNSFRIVKRRLKKADHTPAQLRSMERAELICKIGFLQGKIEQNPDSRRNRNRQFQIEQAQRRIAVLDTAE